MNTHTALPPQIEAWARDVISQDVDKIMSHYADEIRAFDAVGELEFKGRDNYRAHWQRCLAHCTMTKFEIDRVKMEVSGDLAVCSFLNHCGGKDENGNEGSSWMRATQIYKNTGGGWRIIHEHFSLPMSMETCQLQMDLVPQD
jgi:ketosteroid isomerase-like protein